MERPGPLRVDRLLHYAGVVCLAVAGVLLLATLAVAGTRRLASADRVRRAEQVTDALVAWGLPLAGVGALLLLAAFLLTRPWRP